MPKTKFVRLVAPKKKPDQDLEEVELDESPSDDEIEVGEKVSDFQAKFSGKQYKVRIERFNVQEGDWEWVTRLPLEGFEPFNVLPKYGGGRFKAVLIDEGGRYVKGGIMEFRFAAQVEIQTAEKPRSALEDPVVLIMIENMKSQNAMLMEVLKSSIPAQAAMAPKGLDAIQMMDMLSKFSALTAPKENGVKNLLDMMGLFEKAKDAFTPEERESGGLVSEIKEAIGALALLPQIRAMAPGGPATVPGPVPGRVISPTAPIVMSVVPETKAKGKPVKVPDPISPAAQKILFYVPKLEEAARENQPAEKWAEKILDILDDEVIPALVKEHHGFVTPESIYDRLLEGAKNNEERETVFIHAPSLLPYKEWIFRVMDESIKIVEEPDPLEIHDGPTQ